MGQGITIECKNCGYKKSFTLGVGMMYSSLENVINEVSPDRRETVLNILHSEEIHEIDYQHRLFTCPAYHLLVEHFDYHILYNDNKKCEPEFHCFKCRRKLLPVKASIAEIPCPECGKKSLTQFVSMMWD